MSAENEGLRPIERVVLRMAGEGQSTTEIAGRLGRGPGAIQRMLEMVEYKRRWSAGDERQTANRLRPLERVVLRMRDEGAGFGEIGNRLRRSGAQVRRIEGYARLKLD